MKRRLLCEDVNQMSLVQYLEELGFFPKLIRRDDYWFLSPFRDEKTPSFKVNQKKNVWYDHGIGKGGTMVDFGTLFHHCTVKELLLKLESESINNFSFHPQRMSFDGERKIEEETSGKIGILDSREIIDPGLCEYLRYRRIPIEIARQFCEEIRFELHGKNGLAIGFKNDLGGYELRSPNFKASSSPKAPRLIQNTNSKEVAVFEGFFDFLSCQTINQKFSKNNISLSILQTNFLILNSVAFFEKARQRMEQYESIHLLLDRDQMGSKATQRALEWSSRYVDQSRFYEGYKDANEYLVKSTEHKKSQKRDKGLRL